LWLAFYLYSMKFHYKNIGNFANQLLTLQEFQCTFM
jgi:hypothetical protein